MEREAWDGWPSTWSICRRQGEPFVFGTAGIRLQGTYHGRDVFMVLPVGETIVHCDGGQGFQN